MIKGTTTSFNSAMRGAGNDYDADLAEQDKDYLFNYLVDKTVSVGEEGLGMFSETINFKKKLLANRHGRMVASQTDQGKTWIFGSLKPIQTSNTTCQFKYHVVEQRSRT